jgi:hypothetical protein
MALPVLGGLLIADEVVDILLPVRFYWVRRARWLKLQQARQAATSKPARVAVEPEPMVGLWCAGNARPLERVVRSKDHALSGSSFPLVQGQHLGQGSVSPAK